MSLTSKRPDINSFKELAEDPYYQLSNLKGTDIEVMFLVNIILINYLFFAMNIYITNAGGRSGSNEIYWR